MEMDGPVPVLAIEFYPVQQVTFQRNKQGSGDLVSFNRPNPDDSSPSLLV